MSCVRYIIPRFAQFIPRSSALTTAVVPRKFAKHVLTRRFSTTLPKPKRETITVYFIDRDGERIPAQAAIGTSLLDVAIENGVELEERQFLTFVDCRGGAAANLGIKPWFKLHRFNYLTSFLKSFPSSIFRVSVHFVCQEGSKYTANAKVGDNLLDVVVDNDIDIDGFGACEGTLACSTCHLIFEQEDYDKLPQEPTDEELDMLDLAYGLTDTSRLGCQIIVTKNMDGLTVRVPAGVADAREP